MKKKIACFLGTFSEAQSLGYDYSAELGSVSWLQWRKYETGGSRNLPDTVIIELALPSYRKHDTCSSKKLFCTIINHLPETEKNRLVVHGSYLLKSPSHQHCLVTDEKLTLRYNNQVTHTTYKKHKTCISRNLPDSLIILFTLSSYR